MKKRMMLPILGILFAALFFTGCGKKETVKLEETKAEINTEKESKEIPDSEEKEKSEKVLDSGKAEKSNGFYGSLKVTKAQLTDAAGNPVQLRGISSHGLSWYPEYVSEASMKQIKEEWNCNVFRLAMYTAENGGYCTSDDANQQKLKELIDAGVQAAIKQQMYVIIDWHILSDNNPQTYKEEASCFFDEMSEKYAGIPNVLYEICNEPNGSTQWSDVKSYAEEVIPIIRNHDKDAVLLIGTPTWSQDVDKAAADPISDQENIMYTLHFYAATHKEDLRNKLKAAVKEGLPIFVSEFGICDASGNGAIDEAEADQWMNLLDENHISYVLWNLSNKNESSAILKSNCSKTSGFTADDLSAEGLWYLKHMQKNSEIGTENAKAEPDGDQPADENQLTDEEETTDADKMDKTENEEDVGLAVTNSWQEGNQTFYQYSLTITNHSEETLEDWSVRITFNQKIELSNGWCASYQADENTITITPESYNAMIESGKSSADIGFIIKSSEGLEVKEKELSNAE